VKKLLKSYRAEIDSVDSRVLELLNRRVSLVKLIGLLKQRHGLSLYDPARERDILARMNNTNLGPMDETAVTKIFRRILHESRRIANASQDVSLP